MTRIQGKVVRTNDYGLIVVEDTKGHQYAVTSDKVKNAPPDTQWVRGSAIEVMVENEVVREALKP